MSVVKVIESNMAYRGSECVFNKIISEQFKSDLIGRVSIRRTGKIARFYVGDSSSSACLCRCLV